MSKKHDVLPITLLEQLDTSSAGYDILRYIGLPELFGSEKDILLYFMGKNLARKFQLETLSDIFYFFEKVGWGHLNLFKKKRKELVFHLLSDSVVKRLNANINADFRLEAGFLAESIHKLKGIECECVEQVNDKLHQVEFKVLFIE